MSNVIGLQCFNRINYRCSKNCIGPEVGNGDGVNPCGYSLASSRLDILKFARMFCWANSIKTPAITMTDERPVVTQ